MKLGDLMNRFYTKISQSRAQKQPDLESAFPKSLEMAECLLIYAADTGVLVQSSDALTISKARDAYMSKTLNPQMEADFWATFTKIRADVKPVSLEGIGRPAAVSARRMKTRYTRIGSILVILIILISIISLSGKAFINDVDEKIDSICKTQTDLDCTHLKFKENGKIDEFTVGITTYQIWTKLWWFDVFLAGFAQNEIKKIYNNAKGYDGQFFEAMWSARSVEDKFTTVYVTIIGGFLPIMYTVLGAVAFGIRDLRQSTAERTWTQASEMGATLRLFLAIVVGAVFGLFSDFAKGVSLSPIALGFVVGYGVEAFFNFLDSLLGSLGFRSKAEPQAQK